MENIYYDFPPWEIFEAVITGSTWGSSVNGGPVWVWDFRFENLKRLFPDHPWIERYNTYSPDKRWDITYNIERSAGVVIRKLKLCNILVVTDNPYNKIDINFHGLFSLCCLLKEILKQRIPVGAPLSVISFILCDQRSKIKGNDYVWSTELTDTFSGELPAFPNSLLGGRSGTGLIVSDQVYYYLPYPHIDFLKYNDRDICGVMVREFTGKDPKLVQQVSDWEIWLPNLIYDCLELAFLKYWLWGENGKEVSYPLMHYNEALDDGCTKELEVLYRKNETHLLKLTIPHVTTPELWHREFKPKQYWRVRTD